MPPTGVPAMVDGQRPGAAARASGRTGGEERRVGGCREGIAKPIAVEFVHRHGRSIRGSIRRWRNAWNRWWWRSIRADRRSGPRSRCPGNWRALAANRAGQGEAIVFAGAEIHAGEAVGKDLRLRHLDVQLVVDESSSGAALGGGRGAPGGERGVAAGHGEQRIDDAVEPLGSLVQPLHVAEQKKRIRRYRQPDADAGVVQAPGGDEPVAEEIGLIPGILSVIIVRRRVQAVGPRFGHHIDDAAGGVAEFRRRRRREHLHFRRGLLHHEGGNVDVVREIIIGGADAIEKEYVAEAFAAECQQPRGALHHARRQQHQRVQGKGDGGQGVNLVVVDQGGDAGLAVLHGGDGPLRLVRSGRLVGE